MFLVHLEKNTKENKLWLSLISRIVFLLSRPPIKLRRSRNLLIIKVFDRRRDVLRGYIQS